MLEYEGAKNQNIESCPNEVLSFDIFTVGYLQNIFMELDLYLMS